MMLHHRLSAVIRCLLLLCLPWPCWADEVRLRNGDRLTGRIVTMQEETLTLDTDHSGAVRVQWREIGEIIADKALTIQLGETLDTLDWSDLLYTRYKTITADRLGVGGPIDLAQVKAINPPPPIRYQGTLNIGGNRTQGNTETQAVNASTRWSIRSDRHRLLAEAKFNYGEVGSRVTVRNSLASLKYDLFLSPKIFTNAEALFEKDTFQNLSLRSTLGVGLGYQFVDTQRSTVAGVAGLAYVSEDYTNAPSTRTPSMRWSVRTSFALVPDRLKFFHKHEGFYDVGTRQAIRFFADQGVQITLISNLFLNVEYDLRYNGAPAPGRRRVDEAMIFGLGYEFRR